MCYVDVFASAGCLGGHFTPPAAGRAWINSDWSFSPNSSFQSAPNAASARVSCYIDQSLTPSGSGTGDHYFDKIYLTPAPGMY